MSDSAKLLLVGLIAYLAYRAYQASENVSANGMLCVTSDVYSPWIQQLSETRNMDVFNDPACR